MTAPPPPVPQSDSDLWKVYANKIRETYFSGETLGDMNRIYIPPLNSQAIMAGTHVDENMTRFGVVRTGNALITPDNPMLTFSGETYSQKMGRYLWSVQLGGNSDIGLAQVASDRKDTVTKKQQALSDAQDAAGAAFDKDRFKPSDQTINDWAIHKFPQLNSAQQDLAGAVGAYNQIMTQIYGDGYQDLQNAQDTLTAANNIQQASTYTMEVTPTLIGSSNVTAQSKRYAPAFDMDPGYPTAVQNWINKAADRNPPTPQLTFSSKEASNYTWEQVGHKSESFSGSVGWSPFFSASYSSHNEHKSVYSTTENASTELNFAISAQGIQSFELGPDQSWDQGDVKKKFPNLFDNAPKDLWSPMFRVARVVVGYNVSMKITMGQQLYKQIKQNISDASSQDASASASFFGFRLNLGGGAHVSQDSSTDYSKVKSSDHDFSFTIPGSNNTLPILLAVLGTQVGGNN